MARREYPASSKVRDVGAFRRRDNGQPAERRKRDYPTRDRARISCWVEVTHWHGWGAAKAD